MVCDPTMPRNPSDATRNVYYFVRISRLEKYTNTYSETAYYLCVLEGVFCCDLGGLVVARGS